MQRIQLFKISFACAVILGVALFLSACGGIDGSNPTPADAGSASTVVSKGAITGFGSVHVNGEHFLTESTQFTIDGAAGSQGDLRVGDFVSVHAHRDGQGNWHADRIDSHAEVRGPVTAVDTTAGSLVVLGQTVLVDGDTSFDPSIPGAALTGIAVSDVMEVHGTRRADGAILATRIGKRGAGASFEVSGAVSMLDVAAHTFHINALVVDYSGATLQHFASGQPADGDLVEVRSVSLSAAGELLARTVDKEDRDDGVPGDRGELEGVITRFASATDFDVNGRKVTTTSSTTFEGGAASDLALDVRVEVQGAVGADGVLVATRIELRPRADARIAAPIDSIDAAAGKLVVLGIDVMVNTTTRVEDQGDQHVAMFNLSHLSVGDYVEIRGAEQGTTNDVVALRLERRHAQSEVHLRGVVDSATAPDFSILGVTIHTTASTRFGDDHDAAQTADTFFDSLTGKTVSVTGTVTNGVLLAREVTFEDD